MTEIRPTVPESIDRDTVQSVSKLALATLSLVFVLYLASVLPGVDRLVPGAPVTVAAVISAVVTVAVVALLLYLAPTLADLVRTALQGHEDPAEHGSTSSGSRVRQNAVDDVAAIVHLFVVLIAVLVAHRGLERAVVPLLGGAAWVYDVLFLALALPPLAILAARLYVSLDPISELLADRVTTAGEGGNEDEDEDE